MNVLCFMLDNKDGIKNFICKAESCHMFQPGIRHVARGPLLEKLFVLGNKGECTASKFQSKKANKWRKLQKDFLVEHLSKWIADYALLSKERGEGLYSYLTNISAKWIALDLEYLMAENQ